MLVTSSLIELHLKFHFTFLRSEVLQSEMEAKILGVFISITLQWNCHVSDVIKIGQLAHIFLKRANFPLLSS